MLEPLNPAPIETPVVTANTLIAAPLWIQWFNAVFNAIEGLAYASTFTPVWFGFSVNPTGKLAFGTLGNFGWVSSLKGLSGTSNSTSMAILNVPHLIMPSQALVAAPAYLIDNGAVAFGAVSTGGLSTIEFAKGSAPPSTTGFTNSGTKGLPAGFLAMWPLE